MAIVETSALAERAEKILTFRLAGEEYGLPVLTVQEIIQWVDITRVPRTPTFICGVINLRGKVIAVLDLRQKFGLPPGAVTPRTCIVVLQVQREMGPLVIGVVVDEVTEVLDIPAGQIGLPPEFGARVDTAFISGIGQFGQRVIILLKAEKILDTRDWSSVEKVSTEAKEQNHE